MPAVGAFIYAFAGAKTAAALAAGAAFPAVTQAGAFLGQNVFGRLLLSVVINAGFYAVTRQDGQVQDLDAVRINSRTSVPPRYRAAGPVAVGGASDIFGEFDEDGNFWYIVAHCDAELTNDPTYLLDGVEVELSDGTDGFTEGDVITDAFCLNEDGDVYESGTRRPFFRLYTVTPDSSNVYGTKPTAFTDAFPDLPSDFLLVGVTYTIVRIRAVQLEHRHKVYRWQGPKGLGEPSVTLYGDFERIYDPREAGHDIDDDTTWTASGGNPALIWGWNRLSESGFNMDVADINWDKVEEAAEDCEDQILNRSAEYVDRYKCGIAASEESAPHEVEAQILATCDGFTAYDEEGKAYPVIGKYYAPDLTFTARRDIFSAQTEIVDDGETPVDGVVVSYISPDHGYTKQDSAPWQNPNYYVSGRVPRYRKVEILGCQDHNQAFRLAGALGMRFGSTKRIALETTIKGILAKRRRFIDLDYDSDFTGDFEIASPVERNGNGRTFAFAAVPVASNRWTGAGQTEGTPPALTPSLNIDDDLEVAQNVTITVRRIDTDSGKALRIEATFDDPTRIDRSYQFRYEVETNVYEDFSVDMDEARAWSAIVSDGQDYDVQWQTVTAGGRASGWAADVGGGETEYTVTAVANDTAPDDLVSSNAVAGGAGEIDYTWTTANDTNQHSVIPYHGATTTFGSAVAQTPILSGPNDSAAVTATGIGAGTIYVWLVPANGSGVEGNEDGPYTVTVA